MEEIYKRIKSLRQSKGMTQSELAAKVGYADKGMISRVENGRVDISQSQILSFAKALDTTPAHLMGWKELPPAATVHLKPKFSPTDEEIEMLVELRTLDKSFNKAIRASIASAYADYMESHPEMFNIKMMSQDEHKDIH